MEAYVADSPAAADSRDARREATRRSRTASDRTIRYNRPIERSTRVELRLAQSSANPLGRLKSFSRVAHRPADGVGMK